MEKPSLQEFPIGQGLFGVERVRGIEPPYSAWEADILPLNYTRKFFTLYQAQVENASIFS